MPQSDRSLEIGLVLIRLSLAAFLLVWTFKKLATPAVGQGIFEKFYFSSPSGTMILVLGVLQLLLVLAFAAGAFKFWTYGAVTLMHGFGTLTTLGVLAQPFEGVNALFWAAVPTLAAMIALFLVRDKDRLLSLH